MPDRLIAPPQPSAIAAGDTWDELVRRHDEYQSDHAAGHDGTVPEHRPVAAVLACSDARVPPSTIFEQPPGALFLVRLAGNSATAGAVASLTYAVDQLEVPLVIVLGHTGCGAVDAALSLGPDHPVAALLAPILGPIDEMLDDCELCQRDGDAAVIANVRRNLQRLVRDRGPLGRAICDGRVALRGAVHDLASGRLIEVPLVGRAPAAT